VVRVKMMNKETYQQRKEAGLCPNCNCKNDRPGKVFCSVCAKKRKASYLRSKPITNFQRRKENLTVEDCINDILSGDCDLRCPISAESDERYCEHKQGGKECVELLREWADERTVKHEQ
jgi:hypothetical protein